LHEKSPEVRKIGYSVCHKHGTEKNLPSSYFITRGVTQHSQGNAFWKKQHQDPVVPKSVIKNGTQVTPLISLGNIAF